MDTEYKYMIELKFPKLDNYINDTLVHFLVVKQPIAKLSTYYIVTFIMNERKYSKLSEIYSEDKKVDVLLSIFVTKSVDDCNLVEKDEAAYKKRNMVENKPLQIIRMSVIDKLKDAKDKLGMNLVQIILTDPKSVQLDNDYQLAKTFYNKKIKDVMNFYSGILFGDYSINTYERITYNTVKFPQISIKQDVSLLELPFYLQKNYKLSNGLPILFYDSFSSFDIYGKFEMYKIYDLIEYRKFLKKDVSENHPITETYILKEEKINDLRLLKKLSMIPGKIVLIHDDTYSKVIPMNQVLSKDKSTVTNKYKKYNIMNINAPNTAVYNLHVVDNEQNTIQRYLNMIDLFHNIKRIYRVRITRENFMDYDLGIMYKLSKEGKYNFTFLNICYYFYLVNNTYMTCDIVGDLLQFEE